MHWHSLPLVLLTFYSVSGACPKNPDTGFICSGQGQCDGVVCVCYEPFFGPYCQKKACPSGPAWQDVAHKTDLAHSPAVCSGRGHCEYETGSCVCDLLFGGKSCNRLLCPNDCNGNGQCVSARDLALKKYGVHYNMWDADMIYGCKCDMGYTGYDCRLRECPRGDDPVTRGQVNEVQIIECVLNCIEDLDCAGDARFSVGWGDNWSVQIKGSDSIAKMERKINDIKGLGDVSLTFHRSNGALVGTVCDPGASIYTKVEFIGDFGDLNPLRVLSLGVQAPTGHPGGSLKVEVACTTDSQQLSCDRERFAQTSASIVAIAGTKEDKVCSGRGSCNLELGNCECQGYLEEIDDPKNGGSFTGSDGFGGGGQRGDCGHMVRAPMNCYYNNGIAECSGHGVCSDLVDPGETELLCICMAGWTGYDCLDRTCPKGKAWFGVPHYDQGFNTIAGHEMVECSNRGICDTQAGKCRCQFGFTGSACEQLACPRFGSVTCGGNGECFTMALLPNYADDMTPGHKITYGAELFNPFTWDHDQISACVCSPGYTGFDCSLRECPWGRNPMRDIPTPLIQEIQCETRYNSCFKGPFKNVKLANLVEWTYGGWQPLLDNQIPLGDISTLSDTEVALEVDVLNSEVDAILSGCDTDPECAGCVLDLSGNQYRYIKFDGGDAAPPDDLWFDYARESASCAAITDASCEVCAKYFDEGVRTQSPGGVVNEQAYCFFDGDACTTLATESSAPVCTGTKSYQYADTWPDLEHVLEIDLVTGSYAGAAGQFVNPQTNPAQFLESNHEKLYGKLQLHPAVHYLKVQCRVDLIFKGAKTVSVPSQANAVKITELLDVLMPELTIEVAGDALCPRSNQSPITFKSSTGAQIYGTITPPVLDPWDWPLNPYIHLSDVELNVQSSLDADVYMYLSRLYLTGSCDQSQGEECTSFAGVQADVVTIQEGTYGDTECSGQGMCDDISGTCSCVPGFSSSDGHGNRGLIPDCGHLVPDQQYVVRAAAAA